MSLVLLLVVLAVIAGIAVVAAGRGTGLPPAEPVRSARAALPPGDVSREDVDALRFTLALRGYRMDEVDEVLDRLTAELDRRDARIAELEAGPERPGPEDPERSARVPVDEPVGERDGTIREV